MFDAAAQGAPGFHDADQTQAQGRSSMEGELGDVEQRLGIIRSGLAHRYEHGFIDRLLAGAADHRVGQPEQRVVEIDDLQQRLNEIDPQVAPLDVRQLVQQHRLQVVRLQSRRQILRDEDRRPQQAAHGGTARVG